MRQSISTTSNTALPIDTLVDTLTDKLDMQTDTAKQVATPCSITQKLLNNEDIHHLLPHASIAELKSIAELIRHRILEVVSKNGGHLSSTLGAVELIVGMHSVFDCSLHPFIYDVSHQAYAHKLLTGRYKAFESLRQIDGISGFIAPYESSLDYFIAGHSSTSLSLAVGAAKAKKLRNDPHKPIVMIGDGSMSAGLVYEALNELGDLKLPVIIILNDNEMSIAKPIGAISKILSKTIASPLYQSMKEKVKKIVDKMPNGTTFIAKRFEESFKLITPGLLFEEFGIDYIGPIDGNNIEEVVTTLKNVAYLNRPVLLHCQTIKGKGYQIAEGKYEKWHGVAPFDLNTGQAIAKSAIKSPTAVFSDTLLSMAQLNEKIVGVTAAMPSGTGLDKLMDIMPERFFDVAIAEQHAVTSMAAMAKEGFKPYIAIYSTFLQRAFDQIVHDTCIMNLPVVFCIDRAGIVGEDGETHQGLLDVAYLQSIPNITLIAPRDNSTLSLQLEYSQYATSPLAIRYPRGQFMLEKCYMRLDSIIKDYDTKARQNIESNNCHVERSEISQSLDSNKHITESTKSTKETTQTDSKTTACHTEPLGEVSNTESKKDSNKDFSLLSKTQNNKNLESQPFGRVQGIGVQDNENLESCRIVLQNLHNAQNYNTHLKAHKAQMLYDSLVHTKDFIQHNTESSRKKILLIGYGNGVGRMLDVWLSLLIEHNIHASLLDIISLKPLDTDMLTMCLRGYTHIFVMSDSYKLNGVGACIMQFAFSELERGNLAQIPKIISFEIEDIFVKHGNTQKIEKQLNIDTESLVSKILESYF